MTVLTTTNLTKRYGSYIAVDDVDLSIEEGSIFCYVGPNGAGKSTTLSMLLGQTPRTSGTVRVFGSDPETTPSIRRRVGYVPDQFSTFQRLTGREHVEYAIDANDADGDPATLLERVGLSEADDQRARTYSTGMTRRLGVAMALAGAPDLLVLDEPFSGLDPGAVRTVREIIHEEHDRGATVLVSSHVMGEVERIATDVGILVDGELAADGSSETLRERVAIETDRESEKLSIEDVYVAYAQ